MSHDQTTMLSGWLRWTADQLVAIRGDNREIKTRLAALEGQGKWGWLKSIPWKVLAYFVMWTAMLITGHATLPEVKAWLAALRI